MIEPANDGGRAAFDRLHPALQHHVVNSLGWSSLRPLQAAAVEPLLRGDHALVVGPTAGGKTEAAVFPLLSRLLESGAAGLSILYVCPLKALLNNLEPRLARYLGLVGRRVGVWHGDVGQGARKRLLRDPPDLLLTTPESLEAMLLFRREAREVAFRGLQAVVVDELHAFAGDFRGWHLLAVLERLSRLAGRPLQRVGLSATVGNPEALVEWLAGSAPGQRSVIAPPEAAASAADADVTLDFVGSLENAALVVSRLHRGEKRLVFCDSRAQVEELARALRAREVETYVSHSSLSLEARREAERAFQQAQGCVIVSTSTLELGIDVGDLDRVIQIDAPSTVASFLQRLGRTGRRPGATRNCLFLATRDSGFLRATGLLSLWRQGYVEPVTPPAEPLHLFAQQVLALVLQQGALGRDEWRTWLEHWVVTAGIESADTAAILAHLRESGLLFEDQGLLSMGPEGERRFGRKNFLELCSVFASPPLFRVLHGATELGDVHESSFQVRPGGPRPVLLLGGRAWGVQHVDWKRRLAYVEPTDETGRSKWRSDPLPLSFALCRAIRAVLVRGEAPVRLTGRAEEKLRELCSDFSWLREDGTTLRRDEDGDVTWWTFAGARANGTLSSLLTPFAPGPTTFDNLSVPLQPTATLPALAEALAAFPVEALDAAPAPTEGASEVATGLKFDACLPRHLAHRVATRLAADPSAVAGCVREPVHGTTE